LESGYTHFWSRSRQRYWKKGETSGDLQEVKEILYDCDGDALLIKVIQHGKGACHTGERTCFYRKL
ncbi:MAG: phosphoribosyl-AMP cyclohydrolase, partial [Thermodesulfovibrionales bacterium]|nr:phosphoribosyl-AMP cyclohydrolase [Thermodesulfovibrionales bacterium]